MEKTRKELEVITQSADEASEFAESIINTVHEPLISLDQDLRVVTASRSFYEFFKVKPEETVGQLIYDLGNKQWDIPKLRELLETILPQKTSFDNYEVEHDFATIGRRIMLLNARQIQRVSGKEKIILLAIEDITERRRAEETLNESEVNRELFENARVGIYRSKLDGSAIIAVNRKLCELFGYSEEEMLNNPATIRWANSGARNEMVAELRKYGSLHDYEMDILKKSGEIRNLSISVHLYPDQGYLEGSAIDITDRKRAEQTIRRYAELLKLSYDAIIVWRFDGGIESWSLGAERLYGYTQGEVMARVAHEVLATVPPKPWPQIEAEMRASGFWEGELRQCVKDGSEKIVSARLQFVRDPDGVERVLETNRDITERKLAAEDLQKAEERYRTTLDQMMEGCQIIGFDLQYLYINDVAAIHGRSSKEKLLGRTMMEVYPGIENTQMFATMRQCMEQHVPSHMENEFLYPDGTKEWFDLSFEPVPEGVFILSTDVTARKQAEEALKISKERLLFATEGANLGIWNWNIVTGELIWSNQCKALFGVPPDENMSYQRFSDALHPDDRERTDMAAKDALDNHKDYDIEYRSVWPDGSIHWLAAKGRGYYDATGKAVRLEGVVMDITESKRKQKEFKSAKSLLDTVIDSSPFAMWISDREGMLIRTNRSLRETLNLTDEQLIGKYNVLNDVNLQMQGVMPMVKAVFEMNTPARFTIPWNASNAGDVDFKGGSDLYIDVSIFPILDNNGELTNVVCQWVDITERKRAEEEIRRLHQDLERRVVDRTALLQAANKELDSFAYSVSHDLRAPLRSIDGFSLVLLEDYAGKLDEKGKDYLQRVRTATQRMAQLIDDILSLSRVSRSDLRRRRVNLSAVAHEIAGELGKTDPGRDVEFAISPDLKASGDAELLHIVLDNLMRNAFKFTSKHAKARIEFGVADRDGTSAYYVRDNGAGFDMKYADKLFGAFQRMHTLIDFPGTGIGLATVQRIINRHGGKVWAESEVDKGATFYFTLQ